jgi:uncharacterized membrane protein YeaQ/YmgE (transglycosylase-associated protein family)
MKFYFTPTQAPELAGLSPGQRKAVLRCGLEAFLGEDSSRLWSSTFWLFAGLLGGALAGWALAAITDATHFKILAAVAGGLGGAVSGNFIATHFMTERLRPYLKRVLEERREEIERIQ